jgi:hypothetical protein
MQRPKLTQLAETALNPLVGKSVALYFTKSHFTQPLAAKTSASPRYSVASG